MKRLRQWYKDLLFHNKVLFSLIVVSLVPVAILGFFCYAQTRNLLVQREKEVLEETLKQNVTALEGRLSSYKTIIDTLVWNDSLKRAVASEYETNLEMYLVYRDVIDPLILSIKGLNPAVDRITIYSSNETLYPHGEYLMALETMKCSPEMLRDSKIHWYTDGKNGLELYCKIYEENEAKQNVVYMKVNYPQTFSALTELFGEEYGVLITDEAGDTVFSYELLGGDNMSEDLGTVKEEKILQSDDYVVKRAVIEPCNWNILLYRPQKAVSASARSITFLVVVIIIFCIIMVLFISVILSKSVVKPIDELIQNMDQIENGRLSVGIREESSDEIGRLIRHFRKMVERLDYMVNEVYKSRITQQEYEMKALQAQINPHFLYNSLSLINWKAIMADQEEISEMAQLLSTFYRTTLNRGKNVTTVKSEWDNTVSYTRIQSIMHSGKIDIRLDIDEAILKYEILNLLLQPLVENAINHGLDHKETAGDKRLLIRGVEDRDRLVFEVCDNGCGMPEDVLQDILTMKTKGYGVQNVHHRVQLYYGNEYGLFYESKAGEGTRVRLIIPKVIKED